jgi:hypothetical protein
MKGGVGVRDVKMECSPVLAFPSHPRQPSFTLITGSRLSVAAATAVAAAAAVAVAAAVAIAAVVAAAVAPLMCTLASCPPRLPMTSRKQAHTSIDVTCTSRGDSGMLGVGCDGDVVESPPFAARPTCHLPPPAATRAQCTAAIGTHCPVLVRRSRIHLHSPTPTFVRVRRPSFVSASCI